MRTPAAVLLLPKALVLALICIMLTTLLPGSLPPQGVSAAPAAAVVDTDVLNLRSGPGTSYQVLTRMYDGESLSIYAGPSNGWYKVVYGSTVGWTSGSYLALGSATPIDTATVATDVLNVRSGRGTGFMRLTKMYEGESVGILAGPTDGWYQVLYNGITGWSSADYLSLSDEEEVPETATVATDVLNLRSGPGTSNRVLQSMIYGETVVITGQSGDWYQVTHHGTAGWAFGDYLTLGGDSWSFWVPKYQQAHRLSCEYASLQMATEALGNRIPEDDFIDVVGFANNPHYGFRGDIDGDYLSTDDYGVYFEPLEIALPTFGFTGEAFYGGVETLKGHLREGHPVLVSIDLADDFNSSFTMMIDGEPVTMSIYSHVVVVYGFNDDGVMISDPDQSPRRYFVPWDDFNAMWGSMDQMALAVSL